MACFFLLLLIVTSNVYILNAHEEIEDKETKLKLEQKLRKLKAQGDTFSAYKLIDTMIKAYKIQDDFRQLLIKAVATGKKKMHLGTENDKHMLQMNKMQDYVTKLRERGVPEQTALNRASDKMLKYWFKQIEQQGDHHQTEENSSYRVRRDVNDDDDNDPENPYHDPKNPFHFRRKLEDVINKLAEENNTAEVERWQDKINRANIAQKEYFEYVDKRPHDDNITIIVGYDHPGHGEHMARMATYEKVLSKKGLESHIVANKVADKHFAYWLKMVDNKTFANPRIHERKTLPPVIDLGDD
ncbi:hypothetical protein WDU94_002924 [Cyamophila willieti]